MEERIWHDTKRHSIDASTNKGEKWPPLLCSPPPRSRFLLDKHIESVSSFICLSRAWFVSDPVAVVSAPVWGSTCVYCIYYARLRKEKAVWSVGALWCHIQECETVSVFNAVVRGKLGAARRPYSGMVSTTLTVIGWDVA